MLLTSKLYKTSGAWGKNLNLSALQKAESNYFLYTKRKKIIINSLNLVYCFNLAETKMNRKCNCFD